MAVWFIDGFDHYATNADLLRKWTSCTTAPVPTPAGARQQSGQGMSMQNQTVTKVRPGATVDTYTIGFAFQVSITTVATTLVAFKESGTEHVSVRMDTSARLTFTRNGTVLATSTNTLSAGVWYYLEVQCKVHDTTGTYEVRINGSATGWIAAATGADTRNGGTGVLTEFTIGSSNGIITSFDDLYAGDATGGVNASFLGPQVVYALRPAAAGNYAQWTPNFGSNVGNVGEIFPDGDTTFNQDATAGHKDTFAITELPAGATIAAIQHVLYAKQDAGAQRVVRPIERSGTTDYNGVSVNLATSYQMILDVDDVDPATNSAFDPANLNAAEFGYELVS
jgi:hypothetical protein